MLHHDESSFWLKPFWLKGWLIKWHEVIHMNCIAMESNSYSGSPALVARFDTLHGPLQIYSQQALHAICSALPIVKHDDAQAQALLEGFSLEHWASYGRRKSRIASKVCKENGRLKAMLESTSSNWDKRNKVKVHMMMMNTR